MDVRQFRELVVRPTIRALDLWSENAEELLVATACHESAGLRYIKQVRGPALSFYQIEPATARDVIERWLPKQHSTLRERVQIISEFRPGDLIEPRLMCDMRFATVVARLFYWRVPAELPPADDVPAMAIFWGKYYQTKNDPIKIAQFVRNYERFVR